MFMKDYMLKDVSEQSFSSIYYLKHIFITAKVIFKFFFCHTRTYLTDCTLHLQAKLFKLKILPMGFYLPNKIEN